jgi:hypothetical protein
VGAFFRQLPQGTSERQPHPESRSFEKSGSRKPTPLAAHCEQYATSRR